MALLTAHDKQHFLFSPLALLFTIFPAQQPKDLGNFQPVNRSILLLHLLPREINDSALSAQKYIRKVKPSQNTEPRKYRSTPASHTTLK
jgi:hypothetical protein